MAIESTSLMSGNFVSRDKNESRYSKAREAAANARSQMANRQNSILAAGMAACAACDTLVERILEGKKAARRMDMDMRQNVSEKSGETLDKLRKRLEEKTEEIRNPESDTKPADNGINTNEMSARGGNSEKASPSSSAQAAAPQPASINSQVMPGDINIEV